MSVVLLVRFRTTERRNRRMLSRSLKYAVKSLDQRLAKAVEGPVHSIESTPADFKERMDLPVRDPLRPLTAPRRSPKASTEVPLRVPR